MSEKIYEFQLDYSLTPQKRGLLIGYIERNALKIPWKIRHEWVESNKTLHIKTSVVSWQLIFHSKKLEVYGNGPLWAKMLFTDQLRAKLRLGVLMVLSEIGLRDDPKPSKTSKKEHQASRK